MLCLFVFVCHIPDDASDADCGLESDRIRGWHGRQTGTFDPQEMGLWQVSSPRTAAAVQRSNVLRDTAQQRPPFMGVF